MRRLSVAILNHVKKQTNNEINITNLEGYTMKQKDNMSKLSRKEKVLIWIQHALNECSYGFDINAITHIIIVPNISISDKANSI